MRYSMNPIKVIKNVSGLTYDELESNFEAIGIDIKATTLANRYKSTSSHSKMTAEELRKLSLALTDKNPPEGAMQLVDAFGETVMFLNEVLGTEIVTNKDTGHDIISDEDFDDEDFTVDEETVIEEETTDDWDDFGDDWGDDDEEWDVDFDIEEDTSNDFDEDDILASISSNEVPEVPEDDEDNIFNNIDVADSNTITPPSPQVFEDQDWLHGDDDFDSENAKI